MASAGSKVPYGSPTAPPLNYLHSQPPYPGQPPPQQPPPYDAPGSVSYGFQSPPPPYSGNPVPGYNQGYTSPPLSPYIQPPVPAPPAPYIQPPVPAPPAPYIQPPVPAPPAPYIQPPVPAPPAPYIQPPVPAPPAPYIQPPVQAPPAPCIQPPVPAPPAPCIQSTVPTLPGPYIQPPVPPPPGPCIQPPVPTTSSPYIQPPVSAPPGSYIQPPVPPGGYGLYPDLAQVQQPPQVPMTYNNSVSTTSPPVPVRPAPVPPHQAAPTQPHAGPLTMQSTSFAHLKEGEAPAGYVVQWRGGEGLQLFFLQKEGHIVSPKRPLIMSIYKKICVQGSGEGMVEVHGCWRLKLMAGHTPVLHTIPGCFTFMDTSTCPSRIVIVQMPAQLTKKMSEDFLSLLTELSDLRNEDGGVVEKVTTGVATVYDDLTHKLNSAVKGTVPGAHKSTKWLRKGTGSLVRTGGSLVARGIHLVADHIPSNEKPQQEESPMHFELLSGLKLYKKRLEENSITFIN